MRISNPAISQYISNSANPKSQTVDRFPVKAVNIEEPLTTPSTTIPQLITKPTTENFTDSVLIQSKLSDSLSASSQQETLQQKFPYANRRSFDGLAGSSLVIQKYLNNESPPPTQTEGFQRNIDIFI